VVKLHFLGANRQVTGSRYVLEAAGKQVMIDCGMFQERQFQSRNWDCCPIPAAEIDAMLLTHVHIDHSGLIPKVVRDGFRGPIHCTAPSAALAEVMLRDAAEIQMEDAAYKKKRHQREGRRGKYPEIPLYTDDDVTAVLPLLRSCSYHQPIQVTDAIRATFHDAGHILGSAMIEVEISESGRTTKIVFSGDIGQWHKPIIRDPSLLPGGDYVIMESTYGDKMHEDGGDIATQLERVVNETLAAGGNLVIPTFATERAQELMYYFGRLSHERRIPHLPVFLDSPMAVDVTVIFQRFPEYFDEEMWRLINSNQSPLRFPGLTMTRTADESKRINNIRQGCVIMASSGMCNAGRIKHHLKNNIGRPECTILFVGHQSEGTLGRQILDGSREVRIHGEVHRVRARIAQIFGFSAHADRGGLLKWLGSFRQPPKRLFLTHGEESVSLALADHVQKNMGWLVSVPQYEETVELS
jgi:metallo-beta-lactamase family protein